MKRTLLFLTFLIFVINGYSQKYHPIVKEANKWSVVSGGIGATMQVCCVQTNHYRFEGDTTIQSTDYKKILSTTDSINQIWKTIGFIREDTVQKKVWIRDLENQEGLVYDFDLSLGEEITLYNPFFWDTLTYQVSEIDSILVQTEYRKTFTLNIGGWKEKWIEGIGSKFGIVSSNIFGLEGGFRELLCFSDNKIQYVNPKFETCHKTGFSPAITNQTIDKAIVNQNYSFQIRTTEIFDYDSISFFLSGSWLPTGLTLNEETGLISGIPTETGTFHLYICVLNNGYVTDYLETDLVVDNNTSISSINSGNQIRIYPNPVKDMLFVDSGNDNYYFTLEVTDLLGKQLILKNIDKKQDNVSIGYLINGIYVISVYNQETGEKIMIRKLIKE
jgi:hypothetical protein